MAVHGMEQFNPDEESIAAYIERVKLYFEANNTPGKKQVPVFLILSEEITICIVEEPTGARETHPADNEDTD